MSLPYACGLGTRKPSAFARGASASATSIGSDGSGTSWHTLADLANLPADSAAEVTLIWTDHLARLTTQVPLV